MEAETRKLDLRALLGVVAIGLVVLTMWAAGAFAAGGSSSSGNSPGTSDAAPYAQAQGDDESRSREDCPEKDGGSGDQSPDNRGSGGSDSSDL